MESQTILNTLEEASNRLPPQGLASSAGSCTSQLAICFLRINGRFSCGRNILSTGGLQNFLGTHDFPRRVAMHGEEKSALLQATLVSLGFEFRNAHPDKSARNPTDCSSSAQPGQTCHNRTGGYERAQGRDRQQTDACQQSEGAANYATCGR